MSSLLGGKQKSTSTSKQEVNVPSWALGPLQQSLQMAVDASGTPYEAYGDERFANFSQDELDSFNSIRGLQSQWNPAFANASNVLGQVASTGLNGFTQQQLDQYMNPYIQNVMDIQKRRSLEQFDDQLRDYRSRAADAGAFGGSRFGLGEAQMYKDMNQQLADQETLGLASAYESGLAGAERGIARAGTAALSQADLASQAQGLGYNDALQLGQAGGQQRALSQAGLDFDYEQWLNEKAYPYNQASFLAGIASPIAAQVSGSTNTQTTTQSGGNKLGSIMGLASMAAAPFTGGASLMGLGSAGSLAGSFVGGLGGLFNGTSGMSLMNGAGYLAGRGMTGLPSWSPTGYAEGGVVEGEDGPSWVTSKYSPIKYGNALAEWAIENPLEAASWTMMGIPAVGPAVRGASWLGKTLIGTGKVASKIHPKILVGGLGAAGLGLDALLDRKGSTEPVATEFDPADEKDIYKLQQHMAHLASNGQVGSKSDLSKERSKELLDKYPQLNPAQNEMPTETDATISGAMGIQPQTQMEQQVPIESTSQGGIEAAAQEQLSGELNTGSAPSGFWSGEEAPAETGSKFNKPLFQFGADLLMASQKTDFFESMGLAGAAAMERADAQETKEQQLARQRFEDSVELYKLEQRDRQIQNNEKWQAIQAAGQFNPYKQQLDQLKVLQAMKKLEQDPMAKNKLDAWKAMQQNPMAMNTPQGKALNDEVMNMLMSGNTGGATMDSSIPAPPDDLFDE